MPQKKSRRVLVGLHYELRKLLLFRPLSPKVSLCLEEPSIRFAVRDEGGHSVFGNADGGPVDLETIPPSDPVENLEQILQPFYVFLRDNNRRPIPQLVSFAYLPGQERYQIGIFWPSLPYGLSRYADVIARPQLVGPAPVGQKPVAAGDGDAVPVFQPNRSQAFADPLPIETTDRRLHDPARRLVHCVDQQRVRGSRPVSFTVEFHFFSVNLPYVLRRP